MQTQTLSPFHLAVTVNDLDAARHFYGHLLGCPEGRSSDHWIDFNLFGHQFVCHLDTTKSDQSNTSAVDNHGVPVPHFGVVLSMPDWQELADRLRQAGIEFVIEPYIRFQGQPGEQATMFFQDPSGNALEFKGFKDIDAELFKT